MRVLDPSLHPTSGCFICFGPSLCSLFLPRVLGKLVLLVFFWAGAQTLTGVGFVKVHHHGYHREGGRPGRGESEGLRHDCWRDLPGLRRDCHHQPGESSPVFFSVSPVYYRNFKIVTEVKRIDNEPYVPSLAPAIVSHSCAPSPSAPLFGNILKQTPHLHLSICTYLFTR